MLLTIAHQLTMQPQEHLNLGSLYNIQPVEKNNEKDWKQLCVYA